MFFLRFLHTKNILSSLYKASECKDEYIKPYNNFIKRDIDGSVANFWKRLRSTNNSYEGFYENV